jgi:hypothetical protein
MHRNGLSARLLKLEERVAAPASTLRPGRLIVRRLPDETAEAALDRWEIDRSEWARVEVWCWRFADRPCPAPMFIPARLTPEEMAAWVSAIQQAHARLEERRQRHQEGESHG